MGVRALVPASFFTYGVATKVYVNGLCRCWVTRCALTQPTLCRLGGKRLGGYKFRRQQPFGGYILDFVCLEAKLMIEIDGGQHAEQVAYDEARTRDLDAAGFTVLRFWNNEVLQQTEVVLAAI